MTLPTQDIDEVLRKNERDLFLARNSVENLRQNVERLEEELAASEARADALAQEVEGLKAEIETYRTAFDGIEPASRPLPLQETEGD
jgi:chromosome segregation ATPase